MKNKHKICVYAICKNELKFVDKWLDNMSEADSIVILDTGSTDGTYEKLKEDPRVTRVEQQIINPWRFDVARNESMKLIPDDADILVCTDFDELFNKGWAEEVKNLWDSEPNVCRLSYPYAWSHFENGSPSDIFQYDKIHTRDFNWKYPVHEVLWPINDVESNCKTIMTQDTSKLFLQHFQDKTKERKYYFDLLELSASENNDDSHVRMLLAREYLVKSGFFECDDLNKSLETYLETLRMPDIDNPSKRAVLLECLGRVAQIYLVKKNFDEVIWYCNEFIKEDYTFREPYIMLADAYLEMNLPVLAEAVIEAAFKNTTRKFIWIERAGSWEGSLYELLSIANFNLKNFDDAIKNGNIALKYNENSVELLTRQKSYLEAKIDSITEN